MIERVDRERRCPVAAVWETGRRRVERVHPGADGPRAPGASIPPRDLVAVATRPHDVGVRLIGQREAGLAAAEIRLPRGRANSAAPAASTASTAPTAAARVPGSPGSHTNGARVRRHVRNRDRRIARPAHRAVVLPVAVDPVRHLVVGGDVVHLANRQHDLVEGPTMIGRDPHAAVARCNPMIRILWIHPDVVAIAASAAGVDSERLPSVERPVEAAVRHEHFVGVGRIHVDPDVIARTADERPVPAHHAPCAAAIVGPPQRSLIRRLNERVHALRVRACDRDINLADW